MSITKQGILAILSLSPEQRYEYLVKKVADFETLWALFSEEEGFALNIEKDGRQYLLVWPCKAFSDLWISGEFRYFSSREIAVSEFIDKMIPQLIENDIDILCFPPKDGWGLKVKCSQLKNDLIEEMKQYE